VARPFWINAAIRSIIWLGGATALAQLKKPDGATVLAVRPDAIGWLAACLVLAGLALHFWSSVTLAGSERLGAAAETPVVSGPFRYVRHPIYSAGITLLLGVGLLYPTWRVKDLVLPISLLVYFHLIVVHVEEPALRKRFGAKYEEYSRRVPRWLPLLASRKQAAQQSDAADRASRGS
jgi:protein-S-isoprenylcysteine O-methyltransferase Ste14